MYRYHPSPPLSRFSDPAMIFSPGRFTSGLTAKPSPGKGVDVFEEEALTARTAALEAGKVLRRLFRKGVGARKKGEIDLVTDADLRSEKIILGRITEKFPQDSLLAEESGRRAGRLERVWIVDPLDGTTNFAHSLPFFAVSVGLEIQRELVVGVVFNPILNELYEAVRGRGAFLNGRRIAVSRVETLKEALLATGFPYSIHEAPGGPLLRFGRMIARAQGVRRPGAAALDLCWVAAGCMDGHWEEGLKPWDTAAGALILEEAGGRLTTFDGAPYNPHEKTMVASNGLIHEAMLRALAGS